MTNRWQQVDQLFHAALEREPSQRSAFVAQACDGDQMLRDEVESLLASHEQAGSFIEAPAADVAADLLVDSQTRLAVGGRIGHYTVERPLGRGGMGEVYLAQDTTLSRKVALKLLPASFARDRDRVRRFQQEARVVSALNHPNILTIYEISESDGIRFIATEFVDGETLREMIARGGHDLKRVVGIILQVAEALDAAHGAGIVHRDIKPENIMVRRDGYVKVLDFGLAKPAGREHTSGHHMPSQSYRINTTPGVVIGTINYMSPEQARGYDVDARTDIFSLGVVMYEAVTGRVPFDGRTGNDVLIAIAGQNPAPIIESLPEAPPELQRIVDTALRKKPEERYQAIAEMGSDLQKLKDTLGTSTTHSQPSTITEPLLAYATSGARYLISEIKKHRLRAAVVVLVTLALIAGLSVATYRWFTPGAPKPLLSPANLAFTKITSTGKASDPAISPDGKYIVYTEGERLMIRQLMSGAAVQLLPTRAAACRFTPDSNFLYFVSPGGEGSKWPSIGRISVLPGPAQKIVERVSTNVSFSPDGNRMVFVRPDETEQEWLLTLADREGHDEQVLVRRSSRAGRLDGPAWSPDGKLIAVDTIVLNDKARAYHVLMGFRADTGEETLLAPQHWNYIQSIAWLPDGTGLLVCGVDRDGGIEGIWLVSYPGGPAPRRLTNELSHFRGVTVTADGGKIVTSQGDLQASIWLVSNGDTSRGTKLTPLNGLFGEVALMPDGRIVYVLGDDLWIMAADGSGQRQLTFGQGRNVEPRVTANGRYVVFSSSRAGNYNIWRLDLDNGELQQLTSGGRDSRPLCTSDGRWVIYTSQIQSTSTAWKVPLAGGEPTQIGGMDSGSGVVAAISPDDKLLAYQARDMSAKGGQKLYAAIGPLGGGAFRSLPLQNIPRSQGRLDLYWSPDGLIYNAFKDIWLQPIEGGQPKRLTNFAGEGEHVIDFAPNGKNLVVTRGESTWDAVLISVK